MVSPWTGEKSLNAWFVLLVEIDSDPFNWFYYIDVARWWQLAIPRIRRPVVML